MPYLPQCNKFGYSHLPNTFPALGQVCYTCSSCNHYTTLCHCQKTHKLPHDTRNPKRYGRSPRDNRSRCNKDNRCRSSQSPSRCSCHYMPNHDLSNSTSHDKVSLLVQQISLLAYPLLIQGSTEVIQAPSLTDSFETSAYPVEGSLLMERASDGQVSFYTCLMLPTKNDTKTMTVKIDPGAQVTTIPLSQYWKLFPNKFTETRYPKSGSLIPTTHTWISHDGTPKPVLGYSSLM